MTPRFLAAAVAMLLSAGPAHSAKSGAKPSLPRTWQSMADYVMKNGKYWPIKAPASRTLGYDSDLIEAMALRIPSDKSADHREHAIFIVYEKTAKKDVLRPKEIVIGSILVREENSVKDIESFRIRMALDGSVISGMHADGIVGRVKQRAISKDSSEIAPLLAAEKKVVFDNIQIYEPGT